jgi:hypothetical protein
MNVLLIFPHGILYWLNQLAETVVHGEPAVEVLADDAVLSVALMRFACAETDGTDAACSTGFAENET